MAEIKAVPTYLIAAYACGRDIKMCTRGDSLADQLGIIKDYVTTTFYQDCIVYSETQFVDHSPQVEPLSRRGVCAAVAWAQKHMHGYQKMAIILTEPRYLFGSCTVESARLVRMLKNVELHFVRLGIVVPAFGRKRTSFTTIMMNSTAIARDTEARLGRQRRIRPKRQVSAITGPQDT